MWISVVLIILVIVVGLIAGSRLSAPGPQRRAVNASFISLAIMAGLFFILINAFPGDWIVPFFTVACIVVPICIYVGFTRAAVSAEKAANKKAFEIPRAVMTWDDDDEVSAAPAKAATATAPAAVAEKPKTEASKPQPAKAAPAKAETPAEAPAKAAKPEEKPQQKPAAKQAAPIEAKPAAKPEPKSEPKPAKAAEPAAAPKVEKQVEKAAPAKVEKPVEASKPKVEPTPAPAAAPAPAPKPKAAPKVAEDIQASLTAKGSQPAAAKQTAPEFSTAASADLLTGKSSASDEAPQKSLLSEIEALVERDLNVGRKIAEGASEEEVRAAEAAPLTYHDEAQLPSSLQAPTESAAKPEAAAPEPTPAPAPAPEPKPEPKPEPLDPFTELCNKAASLRDQGSYAVAAVIFKKAADAAPSANDARAAQFDELSCYVKAGETAKAKALAAQLRQSSVLTRFERIKLDAVERMG